MDLLRWLVPWEPSILVVVCTALAAWGYLRGLRRGHGHVAWPRQLAWWAGLAILYVGLHTHLDYYAEHQFFIHRLQHLGLHHLGPFLMVLARPGVVLRAALPLRFRTRVLRPVMAWAPLRATFDFLFHPLVAALLFVGLVYLWLVPSIHFYAMLDVRLYKLMNYSMAVDGLLFWWVVLDRRTSPPAHLSPGRRMFTAALAIPPQILIGAYVTFSRHELYAVYDVCGRIFLNVSAATDQYLGGLILWIPSSMMSVLGALLAFSAWVRLDAAGRLPRRHARAHQTTDPAMPRT